MPHEKKQSIDAIRLDSASKSLLLRAHGMDRSGIIAEVTGQLELHKLYVASITFNLVLPNQNQFEMEILAKGSLSDLQHVSQLIDTGEFWQSSEPVTAENIHWPTACMFHVALNTPDCSGLIAHISEIVGKHRGGDTGMDSGSFVHMVGITYNSGGAQGGTAYFSMRANIATRSLAIQQQIEADLRQWAQSNDIENDLWIRDLNP
jgi:hypothetical protein